jgi:hypothetical protein
MRQAAIMRQAERQAARIMREHNAINRIVREHNRMVRVVQEVERQTAMINRIMREHAMINRMVRQLQPAVRQAAMINRIMRQERDLRRRIAGRQNVAPGEPLVRVICQACGAKAGTVEWAGKQRGLISVTGGRRYPSPTRHRCPQCGWLDLSYDDVQAKALQAVDEQRIVPLRAKPHSTP